MNKKIQRWSVGVVALACIVSAGVAVATPLIQDGVNETYAGWDVEPDEGTGAATGIIADGGGGGVTLGGVQAIQISADTEGQLTPPTDVVFSTDFDAGMTLDGLPMVYGDAGVTGLRMDFYAGEEGPPVALGFYFRSDDNVWYYSVNATGMAPETWASFSAPFGQTGAGWIGYEHDDATNEATGFRDPGEFFTDLAAFDQLGVFVTYQPNLDGQVYGVANYGFVPVPEPETYVVLGIALLSVAFVFRKRITDSLAEAREMIQI